MLFWITAMLESGTETLFETNIGVGTPTENTVPFAVIERVTLPTALDLIAKCAAPHASVIALAGVTATPPKVVATDTVAPATGDAGNTHPRAITVRVIGVVLSAGTSLRSRNLLELSSQIDAGAARAVGASNAKRSEAMTRRARRIDF